MRPLAPVCNVLAAAALALCASWPADAASPSTRKAVPKAAGPTPELTVEVPPPSGTWEGTPPPAEGYVWSAGYHAWKDSHYEWKAGEWVLDRPGFDYRQHKWTQRADGKWTLTGGDWVPEKVAGKP